ncbi:hypothetical protein L0F63_004476 [Massospora cicadina]|nr:hypothetical protein L0F63_004476 [Massospora cicadina]
MSREQKEEYDILVKKRLSQRKKKPKASGEKVHSVPRLTLDCALKQMEEDPKAAMAGWSQARITAYNAITTRPNSYYYRFNAPGEEQRTGAWTAEEKKLFLQRLKEHGADKDWGIFSKTIPGRVGYQCSSFYRLLIQRGEIQDPRYFIDDKGKAQFLSVGKQDKIDELKEKRPIKSCAKLPPRKKSKRKSSESSEESSGEEFTAPPKAEWRTTIRTRRLTTDSGLNAKEATPSEQEQVEDEIVNPLPGYIDPITLDEVVQPAISPYGHVMG